MNHREIKKSLLTFVKQHDRQFFDIYQKYIIEELDYVIYYRNIKFNRSLLDHIKKYTYYRYILYTKYKLTDKTQINNIINIIRCIEEYDKKKYTDSVGYVMKYMEIDNNRVISVGGLCVGDVRDVQLGHITKDNNTYYNKIITGGENEEYGNVRYFNDDLNFRDAEDNIDKTMDSTNIYYFINIKWHNHLCWLNSSILLFFYNQDYREYIEKNIKALSKNQIEIYVGKNNYAPIIVDILKLIFNKMKLSGETLNKIDIDNKKTGIKLLDIDLFEITLPNYTSQYNEYLGNLLKYYRNFEPPIINVALKDKFKKIDISPIVKSEITIITDILDYLSDKNSINIENLLYIILQLYFFHKIDEQYENHEIRDIEEYKIILKNRIVDTCYNFYNEPVTDIFRECILSVDVDDNELKKQLPDLTYDKRQFIPYSNAYIAGSNSGHLFIEFITDLCTTVKLGKTTTEKEDVEVTPRVTDIYDELNNICNTLQILHINMKDKCICSEYNEITIYAEVISSYGSDINDFKENLGSPFTSELGILKNFDIGEPDTKGIHIKEKNKKDEHSEECVVQYNTIPYLVDKKSINTINDNIFVLRKAMYKLYTDMQGLNSIMDNIIAEKKAEQSQPQVQQPAAIPAAIPVAQQQPAAIPAAIPVAQQQPQPQVQHQPQPQVQHQPQPQQPRSQPQQPQVQPQAQLQAPSQAQPQSPADQEPELPPVDHQVVPEQESKLDPKKIINRTTPLTANPLYTINDEVFTSIKNKNRIPSDIIDAAREEIKNNSEFYNTNKSPSSYDVKDILNVSHAVKYKYLRDKITTRIDKIGKIDGDKHDIYINNILNVFRSYDYLTALMKKSKRRDVENFPSIDNDEAKKNTYYVIPPQSYDDRPVKILTQKKIGGGNNTHLMHPLYITSYQKNKCIMLHDMNPKLFDKIFIVVDNTDLPITYNIGENTFNIIIDYYKLLPQFNEEYCDIFNTGEKIDIRSIIFYCLYLMNISVDKKIIVSENIKDKLINNNIILSDNVLTTTEYNLNPILNNYMDNIIINKYQVEQLIKNNSNLSNKTFNDFMSNNNINIKLQPKQITGGNNDKFNIQKVFLYSDFHFSDEYVDFILNGYGITNNDVGNYNYISYLYSVYPDKLKKKNTTFETFLYTPSEYIAIFDDNYNNYLINNIELCINLDIKDENKEDIIDNILSYIITIFTAINSLKYKFKDDDTDKKIEYVGGIALKLAALNSILDNYKNDILQHHDKQINRSFYSIDYIIQNYTLIDLEQINPTCKELIDRGIKTLKDIIRDITKEIMKRFGTITDPINKFIYSYLGESSDQYKTNIETIQKLINIICEMTVIFNQDEQQIANLIHPLFLPKIKHLQVYKEYYKKNIRDRIILTPDLPSVKRKKLNIFIPIYNQIHDIIKYINDRNNETELVKREKEIQQHRFNIINLNTFKYDMFTMYDNYLYLIIWSMLNINYIKNYLCSGFYITCKNSFLNTLASIANINNSNIKHTFIEFKQVLQLLNINLKRSLFEIYLKCLYNYFYITADIYNITTYINIKNNILSDIINIKYNVYTTQPYYCKSKFYLIYRDLADDNKIEYNLYFLDVINSFNYKSVNGYHEISYKLIQIIYEYDNDYIVMCINGQKQDEKQQIFTISSCLSTLSKNTYLNKEFIVPTYGNVLLIYELV